MEPEYLALQFKVSCRDSRPDKSRRCSDPDPTPVRQDHTHGPNHAAAQTVWLLPEPHAGDNSDALQVHSKLHKQKNQGGTRLALVL